MGALRRTIRYGEWLVRDDLVGQLGFLDGQLMRARRLVVDTGLHAKKWTRQQVIDYGISPAETERYIVMQGQACAYMIGQLRIVELREKAEKKLASKFDVKEIPQQHFERRLRAVRSPRTRSRRLDCGEEER